MPSSPRLGFLPDPASETFPEIGGDTPAVPVEHTIIRNKNLSSDSSLPDLPQNIREYINNTIETLGRITQHQQLPEINEIGLKALNIYFDKYAGNEGMDANTRGKLRAYSKTLFCLWIRVASLRLPNKF